LICSLKGLGKILPAPRKSSGVVRAARTSPHHAGSGSWFKALNSRGAAPRPKAVF